MRREKMAPNEIERKLEEKKVYIKRVFNYMRFKFYLEGLLGRNVDLVIKKRSKE